ncbi:MAG: TRAP transporter large permease [Actinobacteria bacterium]|nr:TRAP transporter large permease [Actinomycetota bacterium]MBE3128483.1 TRAP transporter large permease [Actinomycetota bacterium]
MSFSLLLMLLIFIFFMFFGLPVTFSMLLSSLVYILITGKDLYIIVHRMFTGIDTFILMAIPFFMLAGELMVYSGTAERLLNFTNVLVGRFYGGLGYVNIFSSMLFGGCSGSAIADVGGLGPLEIDMMEKGGYAKPFSVAVTVSSSIQGPIIPPSIPLVLVGAITGTSIGGLLVGGLIPGILIGLSQCLVVFIIAKKRKFPRSVINLSFAEVLKLVLSTIPFLLMPVIILGGIIGGIFTPTEASAVAIFYGLFLIIVYKGKNIQIKPLIEIIKRAGIISATILMLTAASNVFGWILAVENIPQKFTDILFSITKNPYGILLIINIFLLFWGMFMDSLPAILILIPILLPLAENLGIHPIHFGVVVTYNLMIGLITPPYGAALFTGCIISDLPMEKIVREMLPFIMISIVLLFIITYIPIIVMWLPTIFGLNI